MPVSGQAQSVPRPAVVGPRARMKRIMLDTAMRLMQSGLTPSVSDVAEAAQVSRATAYRYFPSQAAMIQAAVNEALGPILNWTSDSPDVEARIAELLDFALPRIFGHEATHRAALRLALDQWARRQAGTLGGEARIVRGNRKGLLGIVAAPLRDQLKGPTFDRLLQSLSLIFGVEAIVVLKDIWGLDREQAERVAVWAAHALVRAALAEASVVKPVRPGQKSIRNAAKRPRSKRG
jgi:AcrR family transcriptional regulator